MDHEDQTEDRAPAALRYGLPFGAMALFLGLVTAAAFTGTADWGLAIPIGLVIGGIAVVGIAIALQRRSLSITGWIDDYWSRED